MAVASAGCGPTTTSPDQPAVPRAPGEGAAGQPFATPMASFTPRVADTARMLERRLAGAGLRLEHSLAEYRPGEPEALLHAPRAVLRVALADPDAGWLLVYDLRQPDRAAEAGRAFAAYLESGLGRTNYPHDAQFALNQVGGTLVFFWWSRERSADPERAEAAFEAIRGVGEPFPIVR